MKRKRVRNYKKKEKKKCCKDKDIIRKRNCKKKESKGEIERQMCLNYTKLFHTHHMPGVADRAPSRCASQLPRLSDEICRRCGVDRHDGAVDQFV